MGAQRMRNANDPALWQIQASGAPDIRGARNRKYGMVTAFWIGSWLIEPVRGCYVASAIGRVGLRRALTLDFLLQVLVVY